MRITDERTDTCPHRGDLAIDLGYLPLCEKCRPESDADRDARMDGLARAGHARPSRPTPRRGTFRT